MELASKLAILADAAKYDASCASSGTTKRNSRAGGLGSTTGSGICHSYTPDGRCVSLLKILLTNYCIYDCLYRVNRVSSDVQRVSRLDRRAGHLRTVISRDEAARRRARVAIRRESACDRAPLVTVAPTG